MTRIKLPLKKCIKESDLEIGKFYYLKSRAFGETVISRCEKDTHSPIYFQSNMWASDDNPQAFKTWEIIGPVPTHEEICELAGMRTNGTFLPASISPLS